MASASPLTDTSSGPSTFGPFGGFDAAQLRKDVADKSTRSVAEKPDAAIAVTERVRGAVEQPQGYRGSQLPDPPKMIPSPPPPKQESTSMVDAWGSLAMLAAALGGARTRFHATTALNAAADVLKGIHQKDQEKFKNALDTWRTQSDNASRMQSYEMDTYRAIMQRANMDFNQFIKMSQDQQRELAAELKAQALSLQNDRLAQQVDHWQWEDIFKEQQAREKTAEAKEKQESNLRDVTEAVDIYTKEFFLGGAPKPDTAIPPLNDWMLEHFPDQAKKMGIAPPAPKAKEGATRPSAQGRPPDVFYGGKWLRYSGPEAVTQQSYDDPKNWTAAQ